ncbi:MAG: hypothetical protein ATN35_09400 [Epulopiscium sp. Nele67-Bin004]|nr:MAG: hypothetical protein ATN35_09400 [Epulopiscium sp. Nele67-Bin004]
MVEKINHLVSNSLLRTVDFLNCYCLSAATFANFGQKMNMLGLDVDINEESYRYATLPSFLPSFCAGSRFIIAKSDYVSMLQTVTSGPLSSPAGGKIN